MNKYDDKNTNHWWSFVYMTIVLSCMMIVARHIKPQVYTTPTPKVHIQQGFMGLPPPPDCAHLYNVSKHKEWASCMGVRYND